MAIEEDDIRRLDQLAKSLTALQKNYTDFASIKIQKDEVEHKSVSREAVESIISDAFPELQRGLQDLITNIKQTLPPEQRAGFDLAYQQHLPGYNKHIDAVVKEINLLFQD